METWELSWTTSWSTTGSNWVGHPACCTAHAQASAACAAFDSPTLPHPPGPCPSAGMLRVRFVPEMVGSFLQVSLLPQKGTVTTHTYTHAQHIHTYACTHTHTHRQTDRHSVLVGAAFSCCSFEAENYPPVLWHDGVTFTWEGWLSSGKHVHSLPHMPDFWQQNRGSVSSAATCSAFLLFLSSSCALQ